MLFTKTSCISLKMWMVHFHYFFENHPWKLDMMVVKQKLCALLQLWLDPAFAYAEPPSSWPLSRVEWLPGSRHMISACSVTISVPAQPRDHWRHSHVIICGLLVRRVGSAPAAGITNITRCQPLPWGWGPGHLLRRDHTPAMCCQAFSTPFYPTYTSAAHSSDPAPKPSARTPGS